MLKCLSPLTISDAKLERGLSILKASVNEPLVGKEVHDRRGAIAGWLFAGFAVIGQPHIVVRFMAMDNPDHMFRVRL